MLEKVDTNGFACRTSRSESKILQGEDTWSLSEVPFLPTSWLIVRTCGSRKQSGRSRELELWRNWAQEDKWTSSRPLSRGREYPAVERMDVVRCEYNIILNDTTAAALINRKLPSS